MGEKSSETVLGDFIGMSGIVHDEQKSPMVVPFLAHNANGQWDRVT